MTQIAHKHYEAARRAYYWTSFSPDKRAESECKFFDEITAEFTALGADFAWSVAKFEKFFLLSLSAKSRCASSAITGGSGFNVSRAEKASARSHKVSGELLTFIEKVRKLANKGDSGIILGNDPQAIEKLTAELQKEEALHNRNKEANKLLKAGKIEAYKILVGEDEATKHLAFVERAGKCFMLYHTTNSLARIKRLKERLASLEAKKGKENKTVDYTAFKACWNYEQDRLQLLFDGKPAQSTIDNLKSHGFKWSPFNMAWQRVLNRNAEWAAAEVLKHLKQQIAA